MMLIKQTTIICALGIMFTVAADAAPISTNTALPVAKGEYVFREQIIFNQSGDDPSTLDRDHQVSVSASVLGYGVMPDLALFGVLPIVYKRLELPTAGVTRQAGGVGDARIFARYTLFQQDAPGQTFRIAPFLGVELPTGENTKRDALGRLPMSVQPGSGSWDPFGGVILTYQTRDFEIDMLASYQANTEASNFEFGDVARLDGSLQYRLWPRELSEDTSAFVYGVTEFNLIHQEKNQVLNVSNPNSGGTTVFGLIGLQYVNKRQIFEVALQAPLVQDLNGTALERDYILRGSVRVNF